MQEHFSPTANCRPAAGGTQIDTMAWAALARKNVTAAPAAAAKILERREHPDGSMYAPVASVLNDSLHILLSIAVICPRTQRLLLVRDPEMVPIDQDRDLPEFDPSDATAAASALQSWSHSALYLLESSLENGQSIESAVQQACHSQIGLESVQTLGIVSVESYLQGLRRNFVRITIAASAVAPDQSNSSVPHVWLDASLCMQPDFKILRSQDFCPYLVSHMSKAESELKERLTSLQMTVPSHQLDSARGFAHLQLRLAVFSRLHGRLFVARPFHQTSGWVLPETHQDVRGGETLGFAAKRLAMTAFGLEVDLAGVLAIEHDADHHRVAPRITLLAFVDHEPAPFESICAPIVDNSSTLPDEVKAAAAAAGIQLGAANQTPATVSKAPWQWLESGQVHAELDVDPTRDNSFVKVVSVLQTVAAELASSGSKAVEGLREVQNSDVIDSTPSALIAARFAAPLVDL